MKAVVALMFLAGCDGVLQPLTDAERYAPAGDVTSCHRTQSPTGCGPSIACVGTLAACVARGCWIEGTEIYIYADGSWRDPDPESGPWLIGGNAIAENGTPVDFACPGDGGAIVESKGDEQR